ncbi:hypothetical protein ACQCVE_05470 [Metabacillus sp. 113a]|uniref:hypothetical protein n=1 Tax=Metabacillus sp. 113a TaxID=3404706 RepID=UPI003CF5F9AA
MNEHKFINGIKQLNQYSSWAEVTEYLFFDVKKLAVLDESKIANWSTLKYFGISLEYVDGQDLKNLLRYKIATSMNLYTTRFDGDTTELVKEFLLQLISPNVENVTYNKYREFTINDTIKLESDTVNSFATTFNQFMRGILEYIEPNWEQNYLDRYQLNKELAYKIRETHKYLYFLEQIDNWMKHLQDEDRDIWVKFEVFAKISHSIGNFTLVPLTYNSIRGSDKRIRDYWDLTMLDLKLRAQEGILDDNFRWYFRNYNLLYSCRCYIEDTSKVELKDNDSISFFNDHSFTHVLPLKKEMPQCLNNIIRYIVLRGLDMVLDINTKLKDNEVIIEYINNLRHENYLKESEILNNKTENSETSNNHNNEHDIHKNNSKETKETGLLGRIVQQYKNQYNTLKNLSKGIRKEPIVSINEILIFTAQSTAIIYSLVLFFIFVSLNGYSSYVRVEPLNNLYFQSGVFKAVELAIIVSLFLIHILYIINISGVKKITMSILTGVIVIGTIIPVATYKVYYSEEGIRRIGLIPYQVTADQLGQIIKGIVIYGVCYLGMVIITLILLLVEKKTKEITRKWLWLVLGTMILIPLGLFIIQHIVLIVLIAVFVLFKWIRGRKRACPVCHKAHARKLVGQYEVDSRDELFNVEKEFKDSNGNNTGRKYETSRVFTTTKYQIDYRCKYCGNRWEKFEIIKEEKANI